MKVRAQPDWAYEFQDQTGSDTQICGQVLPDRGESGLLFLNILIAKYGISILIRQGPWTQRNIKKNLEHIFFNFQMSRFRTVRTLKICRTSGPDMMSGSSLYLYCPTQGRIKLRNCISVE